MPAPGAPERERQVRLALAAVGRHQRLEQRAQPAQELVGGGKYDAVICFGCVIRGETAHFDHVASAASNGIARVALESKIPVIFGVLTTDTVAQAIERSDPEKFNRGGEAAKSAIEMATVIRQLKAMEPSVNGTEPALRPRRSARKRGT